MKKKLLFIMVVLLLLITYLFFINPIIYHSFEEEYQLHEINADDIAIKKAMHYSMDTININSEFFEYVDVIGWAVTPTELENTERTCEIILYSPDHVYSVGCEIYGRSDVAVALPQLTKYSTEVGFRAKFYTMIVEPGMYNIYLSTRENDIDYGTVDTGYVLEKVGTASNLSSPQAVLEPIEKLVQTSENELCSCSVDYIELTDGIISVSGWAFAPGQNSSLQSVYLQFEASDGTLMQYKAKSSIREDVASAFDNEIYQGSGYSASISNEAFYNGEWIMKILVNTNSKVYESEPRMLIFDNGEFSFQ